MLEDGFDISNVIFNDLYDLLLCKICKKLSNNPVKCSDCNVIYCNFCINSLVSKQTLICKNFQKSQIDRLMLDKHESLIIICKYCKNIFSLTDAKYHEKECEIRSKLSSEFLKNQQISNVESFEFLNIPIIPSLLEQIESSKIRIEELELNNENLKNEIEKIKNDDINYRKLKRDFELNKEVIQEYQILNSLKDSQIDFLKNEVFSLKFKLVKNEAKNDENQFIITKCEEELKISKLNMDILEEKIKILESDNIHLQNENDSYKNIYKCCKCQRFEKIDFLLTMSCSICCGNFCSKCLIKCGDCSSYFCLSHTIQCNSCSERKCFSEFQICLGCNNVQCKNCLDEICRFCDWKFSQNSISNDFIFNDNGHTCKDKTSNECVNRFCIGDKVFSKGIHKWELIIRFPLCNYIDFGIIKLSDPNQIKNLTIDTTPNEDIISVKSMKDFNSFNFFCGVPLTLELNLEAKTFTFEISEIKATRKIQGEFFLPYFQICNNSITLKHIFIIKNFESS